jgi:hypothetical protein
MSPLSATITRVNKQHYEAMIGIALRILAPSQLIPTSKPAHAGRCEGTDRYHRPIASPLRFWLNRNRGWGSRHEHHANRKSGLRRQSAHPGCLRAANADWQEQDRDIAFREV